jgi:peroxiredoxin
MTREPSTGRTTADPDGQDPTAGSGKPRRAWWKRVLDIGLWVVVLGLLVWRFGPQVGAALGIGGTDEPAPDFQVTTLDGDTLRLSDFDDQVVLVNFWATWCAPCRLEMPGFQDVWEDYADRGVTILGLSVDRGDRSQVRRWIRDRDITYPIAFPTGATVRAFGGANVLPTSILVRKGRIVHRVEGFYAEPALRAALDRLLD